MKKRITAAVLSVLLAFSCCSCKEKGGKDDDNNTSAVFQKAESYETLSIGDVKYKLRSDLEPPKDDDSSRKYYTYKGMEIYIGGSLISRKGMTPQTVNDYNTKAVFRDDEVITDEVFKSENYEIAYLTLACDPDEDKDFYSSFTICFGDATFYVSASYNKGNEELAKQVCTEILDSVEFPDTFKLPEGGTHFENELFKASCGDRWYIAPARSEEQDKESEENGSVTFRYKVSENLSEMWSTVSIIPKLDSFNTTIRDYAYSQYEKQKESNNSTFSDQPRESTFNGDASYTFEYKRYASMFTECNQKVVLNYVEHNGLIYQVQYSYGMSDDTDAILADIQQILDSIEFSDLSKEELSNIKEDKVEAYSTENFSFNLNKMFEMNDKYSTNEDMLYFTNNYNMARITFYEDKDAYKKITPEERAENAAGKAYTEQLDKGEKIEYGVRSAGDNTVSYVYNYFDDAHDFLDTSWYYIEKNGRILIICINTPFNRLEEYSGVIDKMLASVEYIGGN